MRTFDALVVGGGPAGSTTAYRLAEAGASVLLVDKAHFPRDKPCGGGLTLRADCDVRKIVIEPGPDGPEATGVWPFFSKNERNWARISLTLFMSTGVRQQNGRRTATARRF